ncbi:MAG: DUF951 domain-containing protein [Dehalococcoidia bacterium]|nr:DUF951 domain-containing protein [Dehalococcoidia bacterium]
MPPRPPTPFTPGDRITLKKPHPCGGGDWEVYRTGADIGLKCLTCGHGVMLPRSEVERRLKARVAASVPTAGRGGAEQGG